jgi:hypothetical protein
VAQPDGGIGNVTPNAPLVQMAMSYSRSRMLCAAARLRVADALEMKCAASTFWPKAVRRIDNAMLALATYVGHANVPDTYWYLTGVPDLMAVAAHNFEEFVSPKGGTPMNKPLPSPSFAALLQRFFTEHLQQHRVVSPRTFAAYRDTFRLLLVFAEKSLGRKPQHFMLSDLNAKLILAFLDHLEAERRTPYAAATHVWQHCPLSSSTRPTMTFLYCRSFNKP